jgi:predicted DsbA family dithiol-disulfide isomerase
MSELPELRVTVFSDYICPFCYVGHHRLMRLRDTYELKINWCFVEIHPETDAAGEPVSSLDYPSAYWDELMHNLESVATEEGIQMAAHDFTTNSHDALLLSEAAKKLGRETFYRLHEKLFSAYFIDQVNIGDRNQLRAIARACGIDDDTIESAWSDEQYQQRLQHNYGLARRYEIQGVPAFIFGEHKLSGVVSEKRMRTAAAELASATA